MRMVLHALADDIGHLVEPAIVHFLHGVQDTALDGLQPILHGGHRSFQDDIAGIVQEPVLVLSCDTGFVLVKIVGYFNFGHGQIYRFRSILFLPILPRCVFWKPLKYFNPYPIPLSMLE